MKTTIRESVYTDVQALTTLRLVHHMLGEVLLTDKQERNEILAARKSVRKVIDKLYAGLNVIR
jgi:hypothetical protein